MFLLPPYRAAIASMRAPRRPFAENSRIAAARISCRDSSALRVAGWAFFAFALRGEIFPERLLARGNRSSTRDSPARAAPASDGQAGCELRRILAGDMLVQPISAMLSRTRTRVAIARCTLQPLLTGK